MCTGLYHALRLGIEGEAAQVEAPGVDAISARWRLKVRRKKDSRKCRSIRTGERNGVSFDLTIIAAIDRFDRSVDRPIGSIDSIDSIFENTKISKRHFLAS